jgi:hypothetical protein
LLILLTDVTKRNLFGSIYGTDFRDIISGTAGSFNATIGWDFVTGVSSNQALNGK